MGNSESHESHGHSHGGKECHGHGAAAPKQQEHGHSHGGQACHGHGNDHGHSHGSQGDGAHSHDQHGHSHGGSDHGHSHGGNNHGHSHGTTILRAAVLTLDSKPVTAWLATTHDAKRLFLAFYHENKPYPIGNKRITGYVQVLNDHLEHEPVYEQQFDPMFKKGQQVALASHFMASTGYLKSYNIIRVLLPLPRTSSSSTTPSSSSSSPSTFDLDFPACDLSRASLDHDKIMRELHQEKAKWEAMLSQKTQIIRDGEQIITPGGETKRGGGEQKIVPVETTMSNDDLEAWEKTLVFRITEDCL